MQITYTHLDNTVSTFTANTAVYGDVYLGNSIPREVNVQYQTLANTAGSGIIAVPAVSMQGDHMFNYMRANVEVSHITDFGFSIWAEERLTAEEKATYSSHAAVWNTLPDHNDDSNFVFWWNKFVTDPHVVLQANV